jgi:drug/metabolite transporter (DMT)-like permease
MQSRRGRQTALAVGGLVAGLVLMVGFRDYHGDSNMVAGFLLGVLLLVIGAAGLMVGGTQTVVVDSVLRRIVITGRSILCSRPGVSIPGRVTGPRSSPGGSDCRNT